MPPGGPSAAATPPASVPTVTSKKPQQEVDHVSRQRNQYSYKSAYSGRSRYSTSTTYVQGGYARVW
jgi:hypothetical protein